METPISLQEELRSAILEEAEDRGFVFDNEDEMLRGELMFTSGDGAEAEDLSEDVNSSKKEDLDVFSTEDFDITLNSSQSDPRASSTLNPSALDAGVMVVDETERAGSVNVGTASLLKNEGGEFTYNTIKTTTQNDALFSVQNKETEDFINTLKEEEKIANNGEHETTSSAVSKREHGFSNIEDVNIKLNEDQIGIPKLNILRSSDVNESDSAVDVLVGIEFTSQSESSIKEQEIKVEKSGAGMNKDQHGLLDISSSSAVDGGESEVGICDPGQSLEMEDLKEKYTKMTKEKDSLQQKLFEIQSEFCSVEIERDLERETSRYLNEQLTSLSSSLLLKENELVSLRKRYRLLNEGFMNSELLREGLEKDISGLTEVIGELEGRLESSKELSQTTEKNEILSLREMLEKERNAKVNVEEMFKTVEEERSLLLKEVEELRNEHQKEINEVNVLRDLLHDKNKQEQTRQLREQQLQRELGQKQEMHGKDVSELQETKVKLSNEISLLQTENKNLEDELYQQLVVLEKLENENKSFAKSRKELNDKLKVVGFSTINQLISEYSSSQKRKLELESKISHLERKISSGNVSEKKEEFSVSKVHFEMSCQKSSCVPRSEYLKLKFQLKSLTEENDVLKQTVKEHTTARHDRQSRKHENRIAKKWLKTMKDSINEIVKEDENATDHGSIVLLNKKLYDANISIEELQHALEISRKEKEHLVSTDSRFRGEIEALKKQLVQSQETQNALLREMNAKLAKAEKNIEDKIQMGIKKEEKIVHLEEQNQELSIELEKLKEIQQSSQKGKDKIEKELEMLKRDILKCFGSLCIQSVSKSFTDAKQKTLEYMQTIENNNNSLSKLTQDLSSSQQVNTVLREELNEARIQLEKKDEVISKKQLNESILEKRESDRLQAVIEALERSKQNETELLAMYTKEKQATEKLQEEVMKLSSELQETRVSLSDKEKECETTNHIMQELEATCGVYEEEFDKSTTKDVQQESELFSDEGQEDNVSETDSDSTAENFREMQEVIQERMVTKVKGLEKRLQETLSALSSYENLNANLQKKLHEAERKYFEKKEVDNAETTDKEFVQTILNKLAEKETEIQQLLRKSSSESQDVKKRSINENKLEEMLSSYRENIKQLKIENAKSEVRLVEANEKIAKLEGRTEICQSCRERTTNEKGVIANSDSSLENDKDKESLVNNPKSITSEDHSNLKEELDCVTTKYINLKAAFERSLKRQSVPEAGHDEREEEMPGNIVGSCASSHIAPEMVVPKFISPLQGKKPVTAELNNEFHELKHFKNPQDTRSISTSSFSEIACAFLESDSESIKSDRMVIELTLTENELNSFEIPEKPTDFVQERINFEKEVNGLRARIIELEKLNSTTANEVYRVKHCSLNERINLEDKLRSLQESHNMINSKLVSVEMEKNSLEEQAKELNNKCLKAKQELQLFQRSISKERKISENTIKESKERDNASKKKKVELEMKIEELRKRMAQLEEKLDECSCENIDLKNVLNRLEGEIEINRKEKEYYMSKISDLEQQTRMLDNETQKSKIFIKDEKLKHEETTRKLECVIVDMEKENEKLKIENAEALSKNQKMKEISEGLIKNHELNMSSVLEEKKRLENVIINLETNITTLEKALVFEKVTNEDLTCKLKAEHETNTDILKNERNYFLAAKEQLQEKVMIMEKEIQDLNFNKDNCSTVIEELKNKINSLSEENQQSMKGLSNERQKLEDSNKKLQNDIIALKETFAFENHAKENTISLIRKENEELLKERKRYQDIEKESQESISLLEERKQDLILEKEHLGGKVKDLEDSISKQKQTLENTIEHLQATIVQLQSEIKEKQLIDERSEARMQETLLALEFENERLKIQNGLLETQIVSSVDEIQRIKVLSFNEKQTLEADVKYLKEKSTLIENTISTDQQTIEHLNFAKQNLETKCNYLQEELERVKVCSFNESQLENKIVKLTDALLAIEKKFEDLKIEKNYLVSREKELTDMVITLQDELQRIKVCACEERESMVDKDEYYCTTAEENKKNFEYEILKRDEELSLLKLTVIELENLKKAFEIDNEKQKEEIGSFKIAMEILENEKNVSEENLLNCKHQIINLTTNLMNLEEDKKALETTVQERDESLSSMIENVDKRQNEKKLLQDAVSKQDNHISLLESNLSQLEKQKASLEMDKLLQNEKLSTVQILVANLEKEKELFQDDIVKCKTEVALLKRTVSQLQEERENLTVGIAGENKKLTEINIRVQKLEEEKASLEGRNIMLNNEMSVLQAKVDEMETEKVSFVNTFTQQDEELSSFKMTMNKLRVENKELEDCIRKQEDQIFSLNQEVASLMEENYSSKQNDCKQKEEISELRSSIAELQDDKKLLEKNVLKCHHEMQLLQSEVLQIKNENASLVSNIALKVEELSLIKISIEKLQERNDVLQEVIVQRDNHISLQEASISRLETQKESLSKDIAEKDEELSVENLNVTRLLQEKKALEEDILKRDNDISLREASLVRVEKENESHLNEIARIEEELSVMKGTVKELQYERKALEEGLVERDADKSLHEASVANLVNNLSKKDEELSASKITLLKLQNEKKALEDKIVNLDTDKSLQEASMVNLLDKSAIKDEELSVMKVTLEELQKEKKALEDEIVKRDTNKSLQEASMASLVGNIATKDEELSFLKLTVSKLEELNQVFVNDITERKGEISLQTTRVERLEHDIAARDEELSLMKASDQQAREEKNVLEEVIAKRDSHISLQEESIAKLKEEKDTCIKEMTIKEETLSALKISFEQLQVSHEKEITERDGQISLQENNIEKLEKEIEDVSKDIVKKDEELSVLKSTFQNLHNEKIALDENCSNRDCEISSLKETIVQLNKEKESLSGDILRKDEELYLTNKSVENLHIELKVSEEHNYSQGNEIALLKSTLDQLWREKEALIDKLEKTDEVLNVMKETTEKLQLEKSAFEENNFTRNNEISLLETTLLQLKNEKEFLSCNIASKDEELLEMKITLENLQNEKRANAENDSNRNKEISLLEITLVELEKDKELLASNISEKDEELCILKLTIEDIQNEKNAFQENNCNLDNEVMLLEKKLAELKEEKGVLTNDICQRDDELYSCKEIIQNLEMHTNTLENKTTEYESEISLLKETCCKLQQEKQSLQNDLLSRDENLSANDVTMEKLCNEKIALENNLLERGSEMQLIQSKLSKLKNENESCRSELEKKDNELSSIMKTVENLQYERKLIEEDVVEKERECSLQEANAAGLEEKNKALEDHLVAKTKELSNSKINLETLGTEKLLLEENIVKRDIEISLLKEKFLELESEKESFENSFTEQNKEFSSLKVIVEELQNEKKAFEDDITKRDEEALSLTTRVFDLQGEMEALTNQNIEKQQRFSALIENIETLENEKDNLENEVNDSREEIISLRNNINQALNEKRSVEVKIQKLEEELLSMKETLRFRQDEKKLLENNQQELNENISQYTLKNERYCEEINRLKNDLQNMTIEKGNVENRVKEINEKAKRDEDEFDRVVSGYLCEIDSWKERLRSMEEKTAFLKDDMEKIRFEKQDLESSISDMHKSKKESDNKIQENIMLFNKEIESWKVMVQNLESEKVILRKDLEELECECERRKVEVETLRDEKEKASAQLREMVLAFEEQKENYEKRWAFDKEKDMKNLRSEFESKLQTLGEQFGAKENELHRKDFEIKQLRDEANQLKNTITEMEEEILNLNSKVLEISGVKIEADKAREKSENELTNLRNVVKSFEDKEMAALNQINDLGYELSRLRNELSIERQNSEKKKSEESAKISIEQSQEQLRVLMADIQETSKVKLGLEKELQDLQTRLEQDSEEKIKLEMDVFCLKEITDELTKGKLTLLEEIARLSDKKKEGQELLNTELVRLRITTNELQNSNEKIEKENSELIMQISSLKVTLATVESAYEQTQDEIKLHKTRLDELVKRENQYKQEQEKLYGRAKELEVKTKYLEEKNRSITMEKTSLNSSLGETRKRLESLEKDFQAAKRENIALVQQLKQQENGDGEGLDSGKSSNVTLRKKLKDLRAKLAEEKKQHEIHEFEIKNLKEKVERFMRNEKESEAQLETARKKMLEIKTERDGLLMDLDSLNKKKKRDMEGYINRIETLEDELRLLKGKESQKADGKQAKEEINVLNEDKKILELKLTSTHERHQREVNELKTTLSSLQNRYKVDSQRFEKTETANKNEILELKKTLISIERKHENQTRELEKLRVNLTAVTSEKEKAEKILSEKNSEVNRWKKQSSNDKAEIKFLRGSLNILEKEGLTKKTQGSPDSVSTE